MKKIGSIGKTLMKILKVFKFYPSDEMHREFVVTLPQLVAEGLYKGPIINIMEPLAEYWEKVITPAAQEYHSNFMVAHDFSWDIAGTCPAVEAN